MAKYCYDYPRPAVTVDIVVCQWQQGRIRVLLIQRAQDPFAGQWALPGGFVDMDEPIEVAAQRELREETGLSDLVLHELGVFGAPGRDPRGRVISVVYYAIVPADRPLAVQSGDDAGAAAWHDLHAPPALAFDHRDILQAARARLRQGALYFLEGLAFLPEEFTIEDLQQAHEALLGQPCEADRLRARLQDWGLLRQTGTWRDGTQGGGQLLYRVDPQRYLGILGEDGLGALARQ